MERINPTVKTLALLAVGLTLSFNGSIWLNVLVLALCAAGLIGVPVNRKKALSILGSALLIALSLFFTALWFGRGDAPSESRNFALEAAAMGSMRSGVMLGTRVLAFAGMGIFFVFTTGRDALVASYIHQLCLPPKYAYGVLAAFHCAGQLKAEYAKVRLAFQVRGMRTGFFSFRPLLVMLVNALHWSGDLAAAMESKGFDGTRNRSYHQIPVVHACDYWFLAAAAGLCAACIACNLL